MIQYYIDKYNQGQRYCALPYHLHDVVQMDILNDGQLPKGPDKTHDYHSESVQFSELYPVNQMA